MRIESLGEIEGKLSEYIKACETEPVIITQDGRATALLIHISEQDDLESLLLTHSPRFKAIIRRSRERVSKSGEGGIEEKEFWQRLDAEYTSGK